MNQLAAAPPDPLGLQRARGSVLAHFAADSRLVRLRQAAPLRVLLPRPSHPAWREAVLLNNAGGIAGGDVLHTQYVLDAGARLLMCSASAERVYRCAAGDPPAQVQTLLQVADGAGAEWLPQPTILFDDCAMDRLLEIRLHGTASLLALECVVLGRTAMNEQVRHARVRDTIRLWRDGVLALHESWQPPPAVAEAMAHAAGGAVAHATLLHVGDDPRGARDALRAVAEVHGGVVTGVSARDGMVMARLAARDAASLHACVRAMLHLLRDGRMLPRVWMC